MRLRKERSSGKDDRKGFTIYGFNRRRVRIENDGEEDEREKRPKVKIKERYGTVKKRTEIMVFLDPNKQTKFLKQLAIIFFNKTGHLDWVVLCRDNGDQTC